MAHSHSGLTLDFSYLDSESVTKNYVSGSSTRPEVDFYIDAISCSSCVRKLEGLTETTPGLVSFRVNAQTKVARATVDLSLTSLQKIGESIERLGFKPIPLTNEIKAQDLKVKAQRMELIRLGVGAACAGNIMTFSFANYLGASRDWSLLFSWLSLALYFPVLTFVAWPFYKGALKSLRARTLSIDLPMAVSSLAGFGFSTYELLSGGDQIYYDSLSGFLFLILLSRRLQSNLQQSFLKPLNFLSSLELNRSRKMEKSGWGWVSTDTVKAGDHLLVKRDETLPADAILQNPQAHFSLAFLSGESEPKVYFQNGRVPAGARVLSSDVQIQVQTPLAQTAFGGWLNQAKAYSLGHSQSVQTSDRLAQWLIGTVFTIAFLFAALYWSVSPTQAIERAMALIVLACPCAMAFGTPLALASAIRRLNDQGVLVKDGSLFEKVQNIQTIFFDKTGTLTETELNLQPGQVITEELQRILLSLENSSHHPIAFALRQSLKTQKPLYRVENFREIPSQGVEGVIEQNHFQLIKVLNGTQTSCQLLRNGEVQLVLNFTHRIHAHAVETLQTLRKKGYRLGLISGDNRDATQSLGRELGFQDHEMFANQSPEQKQQFIQNHPHSMMVGDGVNDALALMAAEVGVACTGGVEAAFRSAQALMTEPGPRGILNLIAASRKAQILIRRNLTLSLVYNTVAGAMALAGFINPYVAALLMPVSSGAIAFSTWWGSRS